MKVVLANLSNESFSQSRKILNRSALKFGIQEVRSYDFNRDLVNTRFYLENESILSQKRGLGFWLWKPHIILEAMRSLNEGDIVVYSDCGIEIISNLSPLIDLCREREQILLFANHNFLNASFTKRDCFVLMNCDSESYWYSIQCDAAFMLFRKSNFTIQFLQSWLNYCKDARILTDLANTCGKENLTGFVDHRHDQSVLSLLAEKYHINLYRKPSHSCSVVLPLKYAYPKGILVREETIHKQKIFSDGYGSVYGDWEDKNGMAVRVNSSVEGRSAYMYDYIVSYLNSNYGRLIYHHRLKNLGTLRRLQMRFVLFLTKSLAKAGYRLEKI